ncbi:MAG: ATP-binding protein [Steroidobacteraceae bacterium]
MAEVSLRRRLLVGLLGGTALAWLTATVVTSVDVHRDIDRLLDAHLHHSARLLISQSAHEVIEINPDELDELSVYDQLVVFQIWDLDSGRLLLRSPEAPPQRFSPVAQGFSDAQVEDRRWRVFSGTDRERHVLVQVAEDQAARGRLVRRLTVNTLVPLVALLPLLGLLVTWIVRRTTRPLVRLGDEMAARRAADLRALPEQGVPLEVQPFIRRLNELFNRIDTLLDSERRFTSHAAHELRTPVAAVRAQAEVARDATADAARTAALAHVIEGCDRMARLIDQLLALARVDAEDAPQRFGPVRLDDLARRELAGLAPAAIQAGGNIEFDSPSPVSVQGDAGLLAILVRNLVDNAIRHGGATPLVTARCIVAGDEAELVVSDRGPGLDAEELAQLGRRFFRGASVKASGSGLGLSIASRIAELHAGALSFAPTAEDGGLTVRLILRADERGVRR